MSKTANLCKKTENKFSSVQEKKHKIISLKLKITTFAKL